MIRLRLGKGRKYAVRKEKAFGGQVFLVFAFVASTVCASPEATIGSLTRRRDSDTVKIPYFISGEPAVVTVDIKIDGVSLPDCAQTNLSGDVNCLVGVGHHVCRWLPSPGFSYSESALSVELTAWPTNRPPMYMAVPLTNSAESVRYYSSAGRLPSPIGDAKWKTSHLLLRKIPSANVEWTMGSPADELGHNIYHYEDQRKIRLSRDFYIGIYPLTVGQFRNMQETIGFDSNVSSTYYLTKNRIPVTDDLPRGGLGYTTLRGSGAANDGDPEPSPDIPIWPSSGHESIVPDCFLGVARAKFALTFDLPSEAEWEFACRAGTTAAFNSDEANNADADRCGPLGWHIGNSKIENPATNAPHSVGQKAPNRYGLYDMHGSIREWCLDWFAPVTASQYVTADAKGVLTDPKGAAQYHQSAEPGRKLKTGYRTLRGGSYLSATNGCRSASRTGYAAVYNLDDGGVRLWLPARAER